jgi:hypothetical protein
VSELCHACGQEIPEAVGKITERELDVLTGWWITGSVKAAARVAGVGEQRAKNMLARARFRNRATTNAELLAMHFPAVRMRGFARMQHNVSESAAA